MIFISLWGNGNIDRMSEGQFVFTVSTGSMYIYVFSAHISETCGLIFNKLGIRQFSVILFLISTSEIYDLR